MCGIRGRVKLTFVILTNQGYPTMFDYRNPSTRVSTAAAILGAIVFAAPVFAASPSDTPEPPIQVAAASSNEGVAISSSNEGAATSSSPETMSAPSAESPSRSAVETRIKDLHQKLKITNAEEPKWDAVAQVMRENAQTMEALQKQRASDAKSMDAVGVVRSYAEVVQAHEDGIKKFIPAFEDLYNSMSDSQKKTADSMFRGRARAEAHKQMSKAGS
jgi:periplasmic protein CpxP/Spy